MKVAGKIVLGILLLGTVGCGLALADGSIKDLSPKAKIGKLAEKGDRTSGYFLAAVPPELAGLPTVFMPRGDSNNQGESCSFVIDSPATVFLCVHNRGTVTLPEGWAKTGLQVSWLAAGNKFTDSVYRKDFPAGVVFIPPHDGKEGNSYGIPHLAIVKFGAATKPAERVAAGKIVAVTGISDGGKVTTAVAKSPRVSDNKYAYHKLPPELAGAVSIYVPRGDGKKEGIAYSFVIDNPATVYLLVHQRGTPAIPAEWTKTGLKAGWTTSGMDFDDAVYKKDFPAGKVEIPAHNGKDAAGYYGIPHAAIIIPR